jgi:hypothetical protein
MKKEYEKREEDNDRRKNKKRIEDTDRRKIL